MERRPDHRYRDPLERIWLTCAERVGFQVERSAEVFAAFDGRRTITLGAPETLDADDSVAQMVLHELCHAAVEAPEGLGRPDWGLDCDSEADLPREWAALRLQAALLEPLGLRWVLAPTTEHRAYYDGLPPDPLAGGDEDVLCAARRALQRIGRPPFGPHVEEALAATAAIVQAARAFAADDAGMPSLYACAGAPAERHPVGFWRRAAAAGEARCRECAWRFEARGGSRCRQAGGARVEAGWGACERWEPALDCQACAACCRAAYHVVEVSRRDPVVRARPEMIVRREAGKPLELLREGDRCAALGGRAGAYACAIYEDRPRTCREFTLGSAHCLDARRRVGLSR